MSKIKISTFHHFIHCPSSKISSFHLFIRCPKYLNFNISSFHLFIQCPSSKISSFHHFIQCPKSKIHHFIISSNVQNKHFDISTCRNLTLASLSTIPSDGHAFFLHQSKWYASIETNFVWSETSRKYSESNHLIFCSIFCWIP